MTILLAAGVVVLAAASQVQFQLLQTVLEIVGALAGVAGFIAGGVAIYKARSEKELNSAQAMALLFEKQREQNMDLIGQRDAEIHQLRRQLEHSTGVREEIQRHLAECVRERLVLLNQVRGLEATLAELRRRTS